jgi:hypothetical protein
MKSNTIKKGIERAPHRALLYATGIPKSEMGKPFIGIATSFTDIIPGHTGMRDLERFIEKAFIPAADTLSFLEFRAFVTGLRWDTEACITVSLQENLLQIGWRPFLRRTSLTA